MPMSAGALLQELSDRELLELVQRGHDPDDYVALEISAAEFAMQVTPEGLSQLVMVARFPLKSLFDWTPPRILLSDKGQGNRQKDELGIGSTSASFRIPVLRAKLQASVVKTGEETIKDLGEKATQWALENPLPREDPETPRVVLPPAP